jgi:hypothetical protein
VTQKMFDDDLKTTIIKALAMLAIIAAEWYMMQPYHEPLVPKFYQALARLFYRIARQFGSLGLECEYRYSEAMS